MLPELLNSPEMFLFWIIALVCGITVHEFAHALVADRLGDPTPRLMGRLTLNPLAHLDPFGTLMIILVRFGWGKPVQFDPFNLRNPRRDGAFISLAGPVANMTLAVLAAAAYQLIINTSMSPFSTPSTLLLVLGNGILKPLVVLNVILGIFNLVPIHPLDGFKIVEGLLPDDYARQWHDLESYGLLFLILLMIPIFGRVSPIDSFISPVITFILNLLLPARGIV